MNNHWPYACIQIPSVRKIRDNRTDINKRLMEKIAENIVSDQGYNSISLLILIIVMIYQIFVSFKADLFCIVRIIFLRLNIALNLLELHSNFSRKK